MEATIQNISVMLHPEPEIAERAGWVGEFMSALHGLTGRITAPERRHVSLNSRLAHPAPPDALIRRAIEAMAEVVMPPFVLAFNRVMSWQNARGRRPLVLTGDEGVIGAVLLHDRIHLALARAGLTRPSRRTIEPHMTLLRDRREAPPTDIVPIAWTVRDFSLVRSPYGESRHEILGRWPLVG